jgi:hypothetical protein
MNMLHGVRVRFPVGSSPSVLTLAIAVTGVLVLAIALALSANASVLVTGSLHPGINSEHHPLAQATSSAPNEPCALSVQFHKRSAPYCLATRTCVGVIRNPGRIRPSPAANRSAAEILNALQRACCSY